MTTELLCEGVLNDNVIHYPDEGKIFKGGYIAIVEEYIPVNDWSNRKQLKRFRSKERLQAYLGKHYSNY